MKYNKQVNYIFNVKLEGQYRKDGSNKKLSELLGWEEMLRMMPIGANFTMYLPSGLAYGPTGKEDLIAPNTVLVFELELVDLKQN